MLESSYHLDILNKKIIISVVNSIDDLKQVIIDNQIEILILYDDAFKEINSFNIEKNNIKELILKNSTNYMNSFLISSPKIFNLNNLSSNLEILILDDLINIFEKINFFPPKLKKLILRTNYNYMLDNLPLELNYLEIDCPEYLHKLCMLPESLRILILKINNNMDLDFLPNKLERLYIRSTHFNSKLNNLPLTLNYLELKCHIYSHNLDYLPENIRTLIFDISYYGHGKKKSLTNNIHLNSLPNNLEKLYIKGIYDRELNNLPRKLKILHLSLNYEKQINDLPIGLEELKIPVKYKYATELFSVKPSIKKIFIGFENKFHSKLITNFKLESIELLSETLEEIEFGDDFNQKLCNLPLKIKKIKFGFNFNYEIDQYMLPDGIEELIFGYNFNHSIYKYPKNLKILKFGRNFSSNLNKLPNGLIELEINERFHEKITELPTTLKILKFNYLAEFNQDLILPDSLHTLILGKCFTKTILNVPKKLKQIILYNTTNDKIEKNLINSDYSGKIIYK